ncbi:MAG: carbohydrate binding family 9 domain-containing protein [Candidatus Aegiribacteria sp.]|nr:carbohydrate binding family 9 domain-containing protein [Candidatus Aegiribacteria sp.]
MKIACTLFVLIIAGISFSQISIQVVKVNESLEIDGIHDDEIWNLAIPVQEDFIQHRPDCGEPMSEPTEVRLLYDDQYLYFAFVMHDSHPEEFTRRVAPRDNDFSTEWIGIWIDTYNDDNNAYFFFTSIDNVQQDGRLCEVGGWDLNWDAVWSSSTASSDSGWTAEFSIPFSALCYSEDEEQVWGINFKRTITRTNESAFLFRMADDGSVRIEDFGNLYGLNSLPSNRQIELRPYGAGRIQYLPDVEEEWDPWANSGIDARIGLSSELLLDLTVNPDFGQVEADPDEANLSHWESYLPEKRPFFLEGSDLFSMPFSLFYSRRIGSVAPNGEIIPIYGGAKLTGSFNGFRAGFLNAYTGGVKDNGSTLVNPTNYAAGRIVREFGRGTYIGFSGTSTDIPGHDGVPYSYGRSGAVDVQLSFLQNHKINSSAAGTWNSTESRWNDNYAYKTFYEYSDERFDFSGGFSFREENFNANMIGYTSSTGDVNTWIYSGLYHPYLSSEVFQHWQGNLNAWYDRVPGGPVTSRGVRLNSGVIFRNKYSAWCTLGYDGSWTDRYEGPEGTEYDGGLSFSYSFSSDSRKQLHGSLWGGLDSYCEGSSNYVGTWINYKPSPNISIEADINWNQTGDARKYDWNLEEWSHRDTDWRSLQLSGNWMFSNDLSLRLTSQMSRFDTEWEAEERTRDYRHWMNVLLSWQFRPGSMFFLMVGENADPDQQTGDFGKSDFTVFTKLTWFLPV